ncbi:TonB-dependent receptor [Fodinibius salsisoli]|uniref:TonB-dependent receptor n=1 Tax=Fodinibius salsisoli TaxID=2820877 RepID=A0ABT3PNP3_9BACT|nr:TonB-dependent receptor [Fodinibius salsisoli]MCW9707477.1 TonB-dependent receptor [Fodinibius salsisoli]
MPKALLCVSLFIIAVQPLFAQKYTISGYVKDEVTGEVLIGANIYNVDNQNGASTNNYGFFSYTTSRDSVELLVSYVGYQSERIILDLDKDVELNIGLTAGKELDEVVVTADQPIEEETRMSTVTVPVEQIKSMPQILGEVDVLKALQMVPGVQSGTEGTSGLYVRGGGPSQNLILLDGVPIYNASHLFGFVSVFNANAINNVELIKGGFPARYGGRLSSVVDITMKEGNKEKLKGSGSVGLLASKLTLDGPLGDNTTFLVSGRRTYIDLLARPIIKSQSNGDGVAGYYFYDVNAKINHRFSNNDRLYMSSYLGRDKAYSRDESNYTSSGTTYYSKDEFGLKWGNIITSLRWNHIYNPQLFSNVTLTYSRYKFNVFNTTIDEESSDANTNRDESSTRYLSGINDFAAKVDYDFIPSPKHNIKFGVSATHHQFNPGVFAYSSSFESDTTLGKQETSSTELFAYAEDQMELTDRLKVNAGLHASAYSVDDELYYSIEPRVSFNYLLPNRIALKGSYARMSQYVHLLTNSGIGLPTDLWVPATQNVKPQRAQQAALGVAKTIEDFEVSVEGYYKTMQNLIAYEEGATYLSIEESWQDKVVSGEGESYGAELFIQKKVGKWSGWLGYTLSWNNRQFDGINFGEPYPYKYDRRHDINAVGSYSPRKGLEYSANWVYGTGNAVTLPTGRYPGAGNNGSVKHYEGRNSFRMPSYHRLDLNVSWTKEKSWGQRTWTIGLYNGYNRKNPFFIDIQSRGPNEGRQFVQYSLFPTIPSVTYSLKF